MSLTVNDFSRHTMGHDLCVMGCLEGSSACARAEKVKFYQLNLEDADLISRKQRVLFVDASKDATLDSFRLYRAEPKMDFSFTSHGRCCTNRI